VLLPLLEVEYRMEKRIAGIIRWLERCLEAQRAGEMESALMDVECAQADMDILRNGVWSKLDRRRAAKQRRLFVTASLKVALGIVFMILATATPLTPLQETRREETETAVVRESVVLAEKTQSIDLFGPAADTEASRPRTGASIVSEPEPLPARAAYADAKRTEPKAEPFRKTQPFQAARQLRTAQQGEKRAMSLSYESILALVQTGERALKNEKPAIEIEEQNRRGF
jgi:hypothetical protein